MKVQKFTETQVLKILKEYDTVIPVVDLSRKYGFYPKTLYSWKKKYTGITDSSLQQLKEIQKQNEQLKKIYANLSLEANALKDLIEKKL